MFLVLKHIILNSTFRRYLYSLPKLYYFKEDLPLCPSITNTEIKALWVSFSTCFYNSKTESSDIWLLKEFSRLRRTTVNTQCLLRDMLGTMTFFSIQMVLKLFFFFFVHKNHLRRLSKIHTLHVSVSDILVWETAATQESSYQQVLQVKLPWRVAPCTLLNLIS